MNNYPTYYNTAANRIALRGAGLHVQDPFFDCNNTSVDQTQLGWFRPREETFPWTGVIYRARENGAIGPSRE